MIIISSVCWSYLVFIYPVDWEDNPEESGDSVKAKQTFFFGEGGSLMRMAWAYYFSS